MDFSIATELYPDDYWYRSDAYLNIEPELDLVQVIQQLHGSLDPRTVFACFGKILGQYLPVKGLQLILDKQKFVWGRHYGIELKRTINDNQDTFTIAYQLSAPLSSSQKKTLGQLESILIQPLNNALKYQSMSNQAMFDALTDLGNRYYYRQAIDIALARANRQQGKVSLIVLDLDKFKQLNDAYGHKVGDYVLVGFAALINQAIRNTDQAFRIGGDEFVIITQGDVNAAAIVCQRIIDMMPRHSELTEYNIQCSLGIAESLPQQHAENIYERADKAMYCAKAAGRNCFRISAN
ncbi:MULTISPECIES: diguanylate cyclase DgcS [Shewanella]|uniref:diguanylate cyclase n=1 Tax=Shewanella psychromarinicola TaxID=2487742 RepID=A0A3N4ECU1_9GAMM|nr:GGDEF domain-containing protein [Shewanella psychromarinicola]AZG36896.1 GGDEF domain-containing protein [Shewanella psychromarinicola]MCL1080975.1 GGDEF domain-containing protein [Shewanella psychromarinicola]RPA34752.1 GGDEF domain-containing protein [Shewanella psychromarinicola]